MTSPSIPPIEGKVTVSVPRDQALDIFTGSFGRWWPHEYHIGSIEVADVILEPGEGGRWYERAIQADGPNQTTVEIEHRRFERLVDGASVHGAIRGGGGWPAPLESYARTVAAEGQEARS